MDKRDWYHGQVVSEAELDQVFNWVEDSIDYLGQDNRLYGIHSGYTVVQNPAGADLTVSVSSGLATNKEGSRMYEASTQALDCEYDEYGTLTRVTPASGNEKYIACFIRPTSRLEAPETDGAGITVYSEIYEDSELFVRQGTEAGAGAAVKVAALTNAIKLCDILLTDGMTQILNASIDTDSREDWFRGVSFTTIANQVHGTAYAAVDSLFTLVDGLATGGGVVFTGTANWDDGTGLAATDVSAAINEIVSDLEANAGSDRVGSAAYATAHGNCDLIAGSILDQLQDICDAVDTAIDSQVIGASTDETIDGAWTFDNTHTLFSDAVAEHENVTFDDCPIFRTIMGGSMPPGSTDDPWMTRDYSGTYNCHGAGDSPNNYLATVGTDALVDICAFVNTSGSMSGEPRHLALLTAGGYVKVYSPRTRASEATVQINTTGYLPAPVGAWQPVAFCFDVAARPYCYIMLWDTGDNSHRVQAYNTDDFSRKAGWPAQGVALPGAGASVAQADRIIVSIQSSEANSRITTVNSWVTRAGAAADPLLTTLKCTDGTIISSGCGDLDTNQTPTGGISTNGSQVYFSTKAAAAVAKISSADINNLPVSSLGLFTPFSLPAGNGCNIYDVICLPDNKIVFNRGDSTAIGADDRSLGIHGADLAAVHRTAWLNVAGTGYSTFEDGSVTFDGRNIWLQMTDSAGVMPIMVRIPLASLSASTSLIASDVCTPYNLLPHESGAGFLAANLGRCCFDGESVWSILDHRASQTYSGIVVRIPAPERY